MPDETFADEKVITTGETEIDLMNPGPAHSPGDIVYLQSGGDMVRVGDLDYRPGFCIGKPHHWGMF